MDPREERVYNGFILCSMLRGECEMVLSVSLYNIALQNQSDLYKYRFINYSNLV